MPARPLEGIRVLEVAQYTYTPAAGAVLADWGATVIKVEHAVMGDAQRSLTTFPNGWSSGRFHPIMEHPNRGKRSIGLALEHEGAREVLYELARRSDVFLTNFLPDARERLRIDLEHLRAVNPQIIYVRGSAFGPRGPLAREGGFDSSVYWARGGSAHTATPPGFDGLIGMPAPAYGDSMGGLSIAGGISAALLARERTGEASVVDVSLLGMGAWAMALAVDVSLGTGEAFPAGWNLNGASEANPLVRAYRTSDGRWINLTMLQAGRYWADFCRHLGRDDLAEDDRYNSMEKMMTRADEVVAIITEEFARRPFAEWLARFASMEGQWAPVQDALELGNDPQLRAAGYIAQITDADGQTRELVTNPVQFDETPAVLTRAPQFAEHTDEILYELGHTQDEVIQLKIDGAVT